MNVSNKIIIINKKLTYMSIIYNFQSKKVSMCKFLIKKCKIKIRT